jgi:hypothetical protein
MPLRAPPAAETILRELLVFAALTDTAAPTARA